LKQPDNKIHALCFLLRFFKDFLSPPPHRPSQPNFNIWQIGIAIIKKGNDKKISQEIYLPNLFYVS
jgi:hypothetical protein